MIDLKKLLTKILQCPRIIETGSIRQPRVSGATLYANWTWNIWSNGEYDLYCELEQNTFALTAQSGKGYYTSFSIALPPRFSDQIVDFVAFNRKQAISSNGGNALITFSPANIAAGSVNCYLFTTVASFSATFTVSIYAHGKF